MKPCDCKTRQAKHEKEGRKEPYFLGHPTGGSEKQMSFIHIHHTALL